MKAILIKEFGGTDQLYIGNHPKPKPNENELLVEVKATALNRADILQRQGKYPPPKGASSILGLEMAGIIEEAGKNVTGWVPGDKVFVLLPGGGYAEYAVIPQGMAMRIPDNLSFEEAAAIPEAFLTAFQALVWLGNIQSGNKVLIHAGASGVGTAAIQLVDLYDGKAFVTAGSSEKLRFCKNLGAAIAVNYKEEDFAEMILEATAGRGVDIIIDCVGAPYWEQNLFCLAIDGRIIVLATMGGAVIEKFNMRAMFKKRSQLITTSLRSRSADYKIDLTQDFVQKILPAFSTGKLKPVVDKTFGWNEVAQAHRYMEENRNMGKIVLNGM